MEFYRYYYFDFYGWERPEIENPEELGYITRRPQFNERRDILFMDPYDAANAVYSERREEAWAAKKIDTVKKAFAYPDDYQIDRDIVHPLAFERAAAKGIPLEPQPTEDLIHDLRDAARFGRERTQRMGRLVERIVAAGLPGLVQFFDAVAEEAATGNCYIAEIVEDYDAVEDFIWRVRQASSTGPMGTPNSIAQDVRDYNAARQLRQLRIEFESFLALPKRDRLEGRDFLKEMTRQSLALAIPGQDEIVREQMIAPPARDIGPSHHVRKLAEVAESVLRRLPPEREEELLFDILRKMDRHESYGDLLLQQARELRGDPSLSWGAPSLRGMISDLRGLVPENAYTLSTDPSGVRARLNRFDFMRRNRPDDEAVLRCIASVLMRLDRAENYEELVQRVISIGEPAIAMLAELGEEMNLLEAQDRRMRDATAQALKQLLAGGREVGWVEW